VRHGTREHGLAVFIQFRKLAGRLRKDEQGGDGQKGEDGDVQSSFIHGYLLDAFHGLKPNSFGNVYGTSKLVS
jgi:hypothetical protein